MIISALFLKYVSGYWVALHSIYCGLSWVGLVIFWFAPSRPNTLYNVERIKEPSRVITSLDDSTAQHNSYLAKDTDLLKKKKQSQEQPSSQSLKMIIIIGMVKASILLL